MLKISTKNRSMKRYKTQEALTTGCKVRMRERESDKGRTLRKLSNLEANRYRRFTTPEETHKE